MNVSVNRRPLGSLLVLVALLAAAVVVGAFVRSGVGVLVLLLLAAAKVAVVVAEYLEIRGAARWLVALWAVWGVLTLGGLAVVLAA